MNATRAAAWPTDHTENPAYRAGNHPRFRPDLRVIHRAGVSAASARTTAAVAAPVNVSFVPSLSPGRPAVLPPPAAPITVPRPAPARLVRARPVTPPSSESGPLRLTRRGRIVVAVMAALVVAGLSLAVAGAAQAIGRVASPRAASANLAEVVVHSGQTLWSVAENADPHADPRAIIQQIVQLNALTSDTLVIGQRLWVPRS